jgi:hypothetical protein
MERIWRRAATALGRRWPIVAAVIVVVTALMSFGLRRLEFATGQDSYLDRHSQTAVDNVTFQEQFGGETVILLFDMAEGSDVSQLFTAGNIDRLRALEAELRAIPEVHAVVTPLTVMEWSEAIVEGPGTTALFDASQRDPDPAAAEIRTADVALGLTRLGEVAERELTDPTWIEFLLWANDGYSATAGAVTAPPVSERVVRPALESSFPGRDVAVGGVVLEGNASLDELSSGTEAVLDATEGFELDGVDTITTGTPIYLKEINDYLQTGMLTLGGIALAMMAVILVLLFGVRLRLLPLLAVVIGIVWAFAVVGFLDISLSLVTISGLPIIIGMGIEFAIQMHNRIEEEDVLGRSAHPLGEAAANIGPPLVAAVGAAVVAFLVLRVSKVPMIRDFGLLLAIGVIVLLVVGCLVPITVLGAREWRRRHVAPLGRSRVERAVVKIGSMPSRFVLPLAVVSIALVALGVSLEGRTKIESDPIRWIDQDSQAVRDIDTLQDRTGFATTLGILIQSNNVLAPEVAEVLTGFVYDAEARPEVISSSSLVGTMAKVIEVPGTSQLAPTTADLEGGLAVAPPDIATELVSPEGTSAQVNLRLAEASLEERSVIVADLRRDLDERLAAIELAPDTVLDVELTDGRPPIRAVPSGLAVVGVSLLENLEANRELLTYLAIAIAALFLVLRFRSLGRALLTLVPVIVAVGVTALVVSLIGIELSPLTTVGGPLVVATCAEFCVLIASRYFEERERGLPAHEAVDMAAARTGRAFFTSAITTVGGFLTLVLSPLPLLRDFGLIVSLNIAIAVLAALVVMPPVLVWADEHSWLEFDHTEGSVRLAAPAEGRRFVTAMASAVVLAGVVGALLLSAEREPTALAASAYSPVALPTTTTTTTTTTTLPPGTPADSVPAIDPADYGTERPAGVITGALYDLLTAQGVAPNQAVCTGEVLLTRTTEADLIAAGIASFTDEALVPVVQAGLDCGISQADIDATIATARGG